MTSIYREREIERKVLFLTDRLIEAALALGLLEGEARNTQYASAVGTVAELCGLLTEVLKGREEHLETLLHQLTAQKLPDRRVLESFGSFAEDLQVLLKEGLELYRRQQAPGTAYAVPELPPDIPPSPLVEADTSAAPGNGLDLSMPDALEPEEETGWIALESTGVATPSQLEADHDTPLPDPLLEICNQVFPDHQVLTNYVFHGTLLDCFVPEMGLAVVLKDNPRSYRGARLDYFCRQEGIRLVVVTQDELQDQRNLARRLRSATRAANYKY